MVLAGSFASVRVGFGQSEADWMGGSYGPDVQGPWRTIPGGRPSVYSSLMRNGTWSGEVVRPVGKGA